MQKEGWKDKERGRAREREVQIDRRAERERATEKGRADREKENEKRYIKKKKAVRERGREELSRRQFRQSHSSEKKRGNTKAQEGRQRSRWREVGRGEAERGSEWVCCRQFRQSSAHINYINFTQSAPPEGVSLSLSHFHHRPATPPAPTEMGESFILLWRYFGGLQLPPPPTPLHSFSIYISSAAASSAFPFTRCFYFMCLPAKLMMQNEENSIKDGNKVCPA